jgi:hypothetical protein
MSCGCLKESRRDGVEQLAIKKAKEYAAKDSAWYVVYRCKGGDVDLMPLATFTANVGSAIAYVSPY